MATDIDELLESIGEVCRRHGVRRLEVFGSLSTGEFREGESDADFFVEFERTGWEGSFRRYMGLKEELEALLGMGVDLVERDAVTNPIFLAVAERSARVVYAA